MRGVMSRYWNQFNHGRNEARRLLQQKLQRKEMGDEAYEKMVSHSDDRAFKIFGVVFIVFFGAVVLVITWLGL
jgi:hypothetical protein